MVTKYRMYTFCIYPRAAIIGGPLSPWNLVWDGIPFFIPSQLVNHCNICWHFSPLVIWQSGGILFVPIITVFCQRPKQAILLRIYSAHITHVYLIITRALFRTHKNYSVQVLVKGLQSEYMSPCGPMKCSPGKNGFSQKTSTTVLR